MNDQIINALCNPIRIKILGCVSKKSKTVSEIIEHCGLSQSAVSQHLVKLKDAGLVTDTKLGREVYYSVKNEKVSKISELLINLGKEI